MQVLVVDDDRPLCELLKKTLENSGMEVTLAHDGDDGASRSISSSFDVVVLDVMMPVLDGFGALQRIKLHSDVPIIMLTARGDEGDRIKGLELGADDYLPKPFSAGELIARIRAVVRRTRKTAATGALQVGDVTLFTCRNQLEVGAHRVAVTGVETIILQLLMERAGEPVSRDHLYKTVLNRSPSPYDRSLDNHVSNLRKKMGRTADGGPRILSVRGIGYKFSR